MCSGVPGKWTSLEQCVRTDVKVMHVWTVIPRLKAIFEKPPYCGVLVDPNGPFAACHAMLNYSTYLNDCVFDACASDGNSKVVCDSVARYAFSCHTAGVIIQNWRTDSFCCKCLDI